MNIPVFMHADPRTMKDSSSILLFAGRYVFESNHVDSVINMTLAGEVIEDIKHGREFHFGFNEKGRASVVVSGTEKHISASMRKIE